METSWYTLTHPNRTTLYLLYTSLCTGELNAIRKHKCFLCSPFSMQGVSLGYIGLTENIKDLKHCAVHCAPWHLRSQAFSGWIRSAGL